MAALSRQRLIFVCLVILSTTCWCKDCTYDVGGKKYSIYDWTWQSVTGNYSYNINFCTSPPVCPGSVICQKTLKTGFVRSIGKKPSDVTKASFPSKDNAGFSVIFDSGLPCTSNRTSNIKGEVLFLCGKSLGSLEVIEEDSCTYVFEFYTTRVCKNYQPIKESPCYFYDSKHQLYDLSPLIKDKGSYQVESPTVASLRINVCRQLSSVKSCSSGSSACLGSQNVGEIQSFSNLVKLYDDNLHIRYATSACSTNITFTCSATEGEVGSGPKLLSSLGCHYEVIWETEHACPIKLSTSQTCSITTPYGKLDLSSLSKKQYKITSGNYTYFLRVCQNFVDFDCNPSALPNSESFAGCQTFGKNKGWTMGDANHMSMNYFNGKVVLTYRRGAKCRTGYMRRTMITFTCDPSAGLGSPKFSNEIYCNYYFDWATSLACQTKNVTDEDCRVVSDTNTVYDLSKLARTDADNWLAVKSGGYHDPGDIYINVCGKVSSDNSKTKSCPSNAAACLIDKSGMAHSLGQYKDPPVLTKDKTSLLLTYSNGGKCGDAERETKTIIRFICAPGQLSTSPLLTRTTMDGCIYTFEWLTAYACPLGIHTGTNCQVSDVEHGFSFDLTPLKSLQPPSGKDYILVKTADYDFQLKVCQGSKQMDCSKNESIGGCQVKPSTGDTHIMGRANSELLYYDGMLKLMYRNGDKCHNKNRTARQVHLTFLCDHTAGIGEPKYEKEVGCGQYNFIWFTKYACLPKAVQCVAYLETSKEVIDLSELSSKTSWQTTSGSSRYYINVCRPLYERPTACSAFSAACVITSSDGGKGTKVKNLGEASSPPLVLPNGDIELTYTKGDACDGGKTITTRIRFICNKDAKQGRPEIDQEQSDSCNFVFRWETEIACSGSASTKYVDHKCKVKEESTGYVFDFSQLKKNGSFYSVAGENKESFAINICGDVGTSSCGKGDGVYLVASCLTSGSISLGTTLSSIELKAQQIILTYYHGQRSSLGADYRTVIEFTCNQSAGLGKPVFQSKVGFTYKFSFATSLACRSQAVECKVEGADKKTYNLQPLEKSDGYWTAINRQRDGRDHEYFLGICEPITDAPTACRKGSYAACQVVHRKSSDIGFSLGFAQESPTAGKKAISIRYAGGTVCHKKYHRSTRIFFHCSKSQGSPVYQLETCDCQYVFSWLTPSACPQVDRTGVDCKVLDPLHQHQFDLNPLQGRYSVRQGDLTVSLPICKSSDAPCSGACFQGPGGKVETIGSYNADLKIVDGDLTLAYSSGDKAVVVKFICDMGAGAKGKGPQSPKTFSSETKRFEFEWRTSLACHSSYELECSAVSVKGKEYAQYDLSPLARWDDNWLPLISREATDLPTKTKIFINVCRQVVRNAETEKCPPYSGICMKIPSGSMVSLGVMKKSPVASDSSITFEYTDGDVCKESPDKRYKAQIVVSEDTGNSDIGEPILIEAANCHYSFIWKSTVARPVKTTQAATTTDNDCKIGQSHTAPSSSEDCRVTNALTGSVFDLNPLRGDADYKVAVGDRHVLLNLCGPLSSSDARGKCGVNSHICVLQDSNSSFHLSAGTYHEKLRYDGFLYLDFKHGDKCPGYDFPRRSVITFVCADAAEKEGIQLLSTLNECTYFFVWRTKHACESRVQCSAFSDEDDFSFSSLKNLNGNYKASIGSGVTDDGTQYYINVCRDLHSAASLKCPQGAAACSVNGNKVQNLGKVTGRPKYLSKDNIALTYENGSPCQSHPDTKISTIITFKCGKGRGNPVLMDIKDGCEYRFEWISERACTQKDKETQNIKKCSVVDNDSGVTFSLESLKRSGRGSKKDYKVSSPSSSSVSYLMNMCSITSVTSGQCSGAAVCQETVKAGKYTYKNIGSLSRTVIDYDAKTELLVVKYGQEGGSNLASSKIVLRCVPHIFPGSPKIVNEGDNIKEYEFSWLSAAACKTPEISCSAQWKGKNELLSALKTVTGYMVTDSERKWTYWINICTGVSNIDIGCPKTAAVCRQPTSGGPSDILSIVDKQQISASKEFVNISFQPGSTQQCNSGWKTEVRVFCSDDSGTMKILKSSEEDCRIVFQLHSSAVCFLRESLGTGGGKSVQHGKRKKSPAGIITAIILLVLAAFLLAIFFRKEERRANFVSFVRMGYKRYICCQRPNPAPFSYREVHGDDTEDDEDDDEGDSTLLQGIGNDSKDKKSTDEYHDDIESDEELLRL